MTQQRIQQSFDAQTMMTTLGATLDSVEEGRVVISAPILPTSLQQLGAAHAALPFAISDSAAGYAALTVMEQGLEVVSAEVKINLLAPGLGDRLRATGKVVKAGKRLVVVTAEVHALDQGRETLIALLQGTMVPVPVR
ncbi:Acyl-coenzyme A thioesterase PaaI [Tritonibacter multivorans]|uniref:Acyl-coenzyme A thioesterase PaaI n=1 Tax=Tritonibacter multivorans TaxID=928856 RepID=A0A0P1G1A9_9RHOB|nr:PaaI family thioesterase [Tritonibacter multivorans]MDA7419484.1 PaaI family thioesterase [Tritonibacter multivorans]CUH75554.1 Acyl-coenzyme A thioesterase PaaI [Tritonibacter multivorans]SFC65371.1 uncharacterized domain 1-containing protein [Tritonibacter multivorans]